MKLLVVDQEQVLFEGVASAARLPGVDGEVCLMDDHEPVFLALKKGTIRLSGVVQRVVDTTENAVTPGYLPTIEIAQGVARMKNNELLVVVEGGGT